MAVQDPWDPKQYSLFQRERHQPFFNLVALLSRTAEPPDVIDLGCGTGELTRELHKELAARATLGIDNSEAMLTAAQRQAVPGLSFRRGDLAELADDHEYDVIFSHAALQWAPDHEGLITRLTARLGPHGQLAFQVPANHDQPSHLVANQVAAEEPWRTALGGYQREKPVLEPEEYASLLYRLGYGEQHVRLQVYGHALASRDEVVEWVRGTLLTEFQRRLPPPLFESFLARYRAVLLPQLADTCPYFYPFKRILVWGHRPG